GEGPLVKQWDWAAGRTSALRNTGAPPVEVLATAPGAVAALDLGGFVRVWRNGQLVITITTMAGLHSPRAVRSLAVTAGGRHVAIGRVDGSLQVIDVDTRTVLTEKSAHRGPVWAVAFSPD